MGALVRGAGIQAPYLVRHEVPLFYEQVAKRIANIIDMITGARGTGKTVMLSELINSFSEDNDWVTIDLDPLQDLVSQFDYKLKSGNGRNKNTEVTINIPEILGAGAEIKIKSIKDTDLEGTIEKSLEKIKKQGRRVFIAIDDVSNTEQIC